MPQMHRCLLLFVLAGLLAGCGASKHPAPRVNAPACAPAVPARMGLCIERRYGAVAPALKRVGFQRANGLDISTYQGSPDFATAHANGIRFTWNQSNDGLGFYDPNFIANWCAEKRHGIIPGAYIFERGNGYSEGQLLARRILAARSACGGGSELPPLLDAEVSGAYEATASAAAGVRSILGNVRVAAYTSPGLWAGCCRDATVLDEAIWWSGGGYNFGGWPGWVAQQFCGTCYFPGVGGQVDLQSDHGVLALVKPPCAGACERAALKARLYRDYRQRNALRGAIRGVRAQLALHKCRTRHGRHAYRRCPDLKRKGDAYHRRGAAVNRDITYLRRRGVT